MNRRDFLKVASAGFGTLLVSGLGVTLINKTQQNAAPAAEAAPLPTAKNGGQNIVVLTGSPHRHGTSALLADKFVEGAQSKGHNVFRFNAAFEDIHACQGCNACHQNGPCILNDTIEKTLMPELLKADIIVLVMPLYYYAMSAQLKTVLDRFYSRLRSFDGKKTFLMATAYNSAGWTFEALVDHYQSLAAYMHWQDLGMVLGYGCGSRRAIEGTEFPEQAFKLGQGI
ncbi:flavodoxin family protein [uncultured Phascolarctobacterium sp.]|uniref:flavodoxin family protein n=1 Tax=uncultured Phascolarctobacterium sp. TaxID=512296 RepID=UPI00261161F3|nr:flavodoxin family protein [uncultured Phascolarctobacterium sp.]